MSAVINTGKRTQRGNIVLRAKEQLSRGVDLCHVIGECVLKGSDENATGQLYCVNLPTVDCLRPTKLTLSCGSSDCVSVCLLYCICLCMSVGLRVKSLAGWGWGRKFPVGFFFFFWLFISDAAKLGVLAGISHPSSCL